MTMAQRGAVCRYLARFAELDDAKILYAYTHVNDLVAREEARTGCFTAVQRVSASGGGEAAPSGCALRVPELCEGGFPA